MPKNSEKFPVVFSPVVISGVDWASGPDHSMEAVFEVGLDGELILVDMGELIEGEFEEA
jgi:hypothetical protein